MLHSAQESIDLHCNYKRKKFLRQVRGASNKVRTHLQKNLKLKIIFNLISFKKEVQCVFILSDICISIS